MSESVISRDLVQAFRETEYRVLDEQPFTLRVDEASPEAGAAVERVFEPLTPIRFAAAFEEAGQ